MDGPYVHLARIELVPAHNRRPSPDVPPYISTFTQWWQSATVRQARSVRSDRRRDDSDVYFSPELVPIATHPEVTALGTGAVRDLLVRRLYDYLTFTIELESLAVIPITSRISRGRAGTDLPDGMREDAFKITTDEAFHAQVAYDLIHDIEIDTGVPYEAGTPSFVRRLDEIREGMAPRVRELEGLLFAVVSETLISRLLSELPKDERLPGPVREILADHALDEGRHHAYFRDVLRLVWPALHDRDRAAVGPWLPHMIRAFLEPDRAALVRSLVAVGIDPTQAPDLLDEVVTPAAVSKDIGAAATTVVRYFTEAGALEDQRTAEAFEAFGLGMRR